MHQAVLHVPTAPEARPSRIQVRRATTMSAAELHEAATMLASVFDSSPLFRAAFPRPAVRSKLVAILFTSVLKDAVRCGQVELAYNGSIVGALVWYPPGRYPLSLFRILRLMPDYARMAVAAPVGLFKLFRAHRMLNRVRPGEPHCHGYFLGGRHGEQVGGILAKILLNEADARSWPLYLETQERRSAKWYTRLGFRMLQDGVEAWPGGPLTWTMWRDPRAMK
jgi:hypothetical protein